MCVWCAYSGKRQAAEILSECGERMEGLWSGYFTGLVTGDEAGLHCGKVAGWSKFWHEKYRVEDFHGTYGLWHSRTNSGGDYRWAHPFVGNFGIAAMVSQGNSGVFAGHDAEHMKIAEKFFQEGMRFSSASPTLEWRKNYPALSDGTQIHVSDLVMQIIEQEYVRTGNPIGSIRHAMELIREEATIVVVFRDRPGELFFATTSQHIVAARYKDGVVLAITSLAFGTPSPRCTELPENSIGCLSPGRLVVEKLSPVFDDIDETMPQGILAAARKFLMDNGPSTVPQLCDGVVRPAMGNGFVPRSTVTYRCLEALMANDEIEIIPDVSVNPDGIEGRMDRIVLI